MRAIRRLVRLTVTLVSMLGLFWANDASALDNPEKVIEETCARDWSHNSRMRAACIEQQLSVLEKSRSTPLDPRLQQEDLSLIQERCAKNWPDDSPHAAPMPAARDPSVSEAARSSAEGRQLERLLGCGGAVLQGMARRFPAARALHGPADCGEAQGPGTRLIPAVGASSGGRNVCSAGRQQCFAGRDLLQQIGANLIDAGEPVAHGKRQSVGLVADQ